jgi:hypothetical protein
MSELEKQPTNFGIENTVESEMGSAGNQDLINDLYGTAGAAGNPDDVLSIEEAEKKEKEEAERKKAEEEAKAKENVPDDKTKNPDALTNFLIGDDEEEEEEKEEVEEEEEEENNAEGAEGGEGAGDDENESSIAFDALAEELQTLGVFNQLEGEESLDVTDPESFLARFKLEQERGATQMVQNFIGQFGQEHQDAFQAIFVDGTNPRDYYTHQAKVEDFKGMDLTKESNQEKIMKTSLQNQGYEPEDIDSEIERLKNYGDLEQVSAKHHKVLVKNEEKALQEKTLEAKKEQQFKQKQKDEYVNNVRAVLTEKIKDKEFDGIPVNLKTANELQDFLLVDKWKTDSGETLTDFDKTILDLKRPENHELKVKVALLLKLIEKDPTLSTIQKSGISKKSSALFKDVARQKTTAKRAESNKRGPAPSWFKK